MILTINGGNTTVLFGLFNNGKLVGQGTLSAKHIGTECEGAIGIKNVLDIYGFKSSEITGVIISPVSPVVSSYLNLAIFKLTGLGAVVVGPGIKTGVDILIDDPSQLGSDIVACAIGAISKYDYPLVVVYLGATATTFIAIDEKGKIIGVVIAPGLAVSFENLGRTADQLPIIPLKKPERIIGKNTVESMEAGIIYGGASMVEGVIEKMTKEMGNAHVNVILTGSIGRLICPVISKSIIFKENLLLEGLYLLYNKNVRSVI